MSRVLRSSASIVALLSLAVAIVLSMGLPVHLIYHHHHGEGSSAASHPSLTHAHGDHGVRDHDWDGLRARIPEFFALPADVGVLIFRGDAPSQIIATAGENAPHSPGLGPPEYRAPPSA